MIDPRPSGSNSLRATIALGAAAMMKIRSVGAVDVSAGLPLTLKCPYILVVVGPAKDCLFQEPLFVPVQIPFLSHSPVSNKHLQIVESAAEPIQLSSAVVRYATSRIQAYCSILANGSPVSGHSHGC